MTLENIALKPEATDLRLADWSAWSVDVRPRHPVVVTCVEGRLLVTLEGDPADHLLAAGEAFTASRRGRLVVAALGPSRARLQAARSSPGPSFAFRAAFAWAVVDVVRDALGLPRLTHEAGGRAAATRR